MTKYKVVLTLFSSLLILSIGADGSEGIQASVQRIAEQSDQIRADHTQRDDTFFMPSEEAMSQARNEAMSLYQDIMSNVDLFEAEQETSLDDDSLSVEPEERILVFVSRSMGATALNRLMDRAEGDSKVQLLFQGIPEGGTLTDAVSDIQSMVLGRQNPPNVSINPNLFREYGITSVPTMVAERKLVGAGTSSEPVYKKVAKVQGLANPEWLRDRVSHGDEGDLGSYGPVTHISEPDLIEVMKRRVMEIDWDEKRENAIASYWEKYQFNHLPPATASRTRSIDPSVYITEDIVTPDGQVVAHAGDVINPLAMRRFTQVIVVFDPLSNQFGKQLQEAIEEAKDRSGAVRVTYIATRMDRDKGWASYEEVANEVGEHIYILTPDVMNRFQIEKTPSIVMAEQGMFVVEELPINRETK